MDVTVFRAGEVHGDSAARTQTEPLDVSVFRGALARRGPGYAVATPRTAHGSCEGRGGWCRRNAGRRARRPSSRAAR